jgi:hypothetical protein
MYASLLNEAPPIISQQNLLSLGVMCATKSRKIFLSLRALIVRVTMVAYQHGLQYFKFETTQEHLTI